MIDTQANNPQRRLGNGAGKLFVFSAIVGLLSLAGSVVISLMQDNSEIAWPSFYRSYLTSFIFVLSLSLGGLFFVLIQHLTKAGWSVVLRRLAEAIAANLIWLWILFIPIFYMMATGNGANLYDWADASHHDDVLARKAAFLNPTFWTIRAVVYFLVWGVAAFFFYRQSVRQDSSDGVSATLRMQRWAPPVVILFAITLAFASIDWIMSLQAHWFSTMFGVYFFAASCCGFFGLLVVLMYILQRAGKLKNEITLEHFQDAGKFLFAFGVVFWAYIAFSQYMLIWYANIPEETGWYITRQLGPWKTVSFVLLAGHFAIPFVLLVTKHTKRIRLVIALIAAWMLLMHFVDVYWLVMPQIPEQAMRDAVTYSDVVQAVENGAELGFNPTLTDLTCLIGMLGLFIAGTTRLLSRCALVPTGDPRLHESLNFENI